MMPPRGTTSRRQPEVRDLVNLQRHLSPPGRAVPHGVRERCPSLTCACSPPNVPAAAQPRPTSPVFRATGPVRPMSEAAAAFEKFSIESLGDPGIPTLRSSLLDAGGAAGSRASWQAPNSPAARHRRMIREDPPTDGVTRPTVAERSRCNNADRVPVRINHAAPETAEPRVVAKRSVSLVRTPKAGFSRQGKAKGPPGIDPPGTGNPDSAESPTRRLWSNRGVLRDIRDKKGTGTGIPVRAAKSTSPTKATRQDDPHAAGGGRVSAPAAPYTRAPRTSDDTPGGDGAATVGAGPESPQRRSTGSAGSSAKKPSSGPLRRVRVSTVTGNGARGGGSAAESEGSLRVKPTPRAPTSATAASGGVTTSQTSPQRVDRLLRACRSRRTARSEPAIVPIARLPPSQQRDDPGMSVIELTPNLLAAKAKDEARGQRSIPMPIRQWQPPTLDALSRASSAGSSESSGSGSLNASPSSRPQSRGSTKSAGPTSPAALSVSGNAAVVSPSSASAAGSPVGPAADGGVNIEARLACLLDDDGATAAEPTHNPVTPREEGDVLRARSQGFTARAFADSKKFSFAPPPLLGQRGLPPALKRRLDRAATLQKLSMEDEARNGWSFSHEWIDANQGMNL